MKKRARRKPAPRRAALKRTVAAKSQSRGRKPTSGAKLHQSTRPSAELFAPSGINLSTPATTARLEISPDRRVDFKAAAMRWLYTLRNRRRWAGQPKVTSEHEVDATTLLREMGATLPKLDEAWQQVIEAGVWEVEIPYAKERKDWDLRIFPWEYVLAAATRELRQGRALTVTRRLMVKRAKRAKPKRIEEPPRVLFVESAPGKLRDEYAFDAEREIVKSQLKGGDFWHIANPTPDELRRTVLEVKPAVVHLAGFDTHQGLALHAQLSPQERSAASPPDGLDGYLMVDDAGRPRAVAARELAALLCGVEHAPYLVSFSTWNSAARCAPLVVAAGASAAIGFQDSFDDAMGELFFARFYQQWRMTDWKLHDAFRAAWETVRGQPTALAGSGVVLWSADGQPKHALPGAKRSKAERLSPTGAVVGIMSSSVKAENVDEWVKVDIKPWKQLNYSLLHNNRPMFERFTLQRPNGEPGVLRGVHVKVQLQTGTDNSSYERSLDLNDAPLDLKDAIHVPLTSSLMRSVHESVNTSLVAEVTWGAHVLYRDSHRVCLLPIDQWRDNESDGTWLPSFVLPRDPAVATLIDRAQRYVRVLRDDPAAGFEGYQCVDPAAPDSLIELERQVEAIWALLIHELDLGYVNPPPSYNSEMDCQRLRTPSMIVESRSGTCIDLALLLAACLELVDIYPVVFLLDDHAFPGYWRTSEAHEKFMSARDNAPSNAATEAAADVNPAPGTQREPWSVGKVAYDEIKRYVQNGDLVPLEGVLLTERASFRDARVAGLENLRSKRRFHSMLDIAIAREKGVTPLPISGGQA